MEIFKDKSLDVVVFVITTALTKLVFENNNIPELYKGLSIVAMIGVFISIYNRKTLFKRIVYLYQRLRNVDSIDTLKAQMSSQKIELDSQIINQKAKIYSQSQKLKDICTKLAGNVNSIRVKIDELILEEGEDSCKFKHNVTVEVRKLQNTLIQLVELQKLMEEVGGDLEAAEQNRIHREINTEAAKAAAYKAFNQDKKQHKNNPL